MQRFFAFTSFFLGVMTAVLVAACGGGGGGPAHVVITSSATADGTTGVGYPGITFSASGGSGIFTWTAAGGLPPGLSLSTAGALSGTPTTAGNYSFTVTATDSSNPPLTASTTASIKIADTMIVLAPASLPTGIVTYPYPGFSFSVASGGSPPFTWNVKTGALPAGLTLGPDGPITGTVSSTAVSSTFTISATDSAQTPQIASQSFTVMIAAPGLLVIATSPGPPAGIVGTAYPGFSFTATGGFLPLTWKATGTLPNGLTLGADGSVTGIPTIAGPFPFTITVTDSAMIPVTTPPAPFTISITNPPPPTINAKPPPTGTVGTPYSFQFTATGGLVPLVWSETSNTQGLALPGLALSFDGILSGTPSGLGGQYPITVNAIDQLKQIATPMPFMVRVSRARPGSFMPIGSMMTARTEHTATLLVGGKVLIAGGRAKQPFLSAELYDPAHPGFTPTGNMIVVRSGHTATLLADARLSNYGKVLMAGGPDASAELYDPASGSFTATGAMTTARPGHTATMLSNSANSAFPHHGEVLLAGGGRDTAELYHPNTGMFSATAKMSIARTGHTATALLDGRVLIAGGGTATAEIYDPSNETFTKTQADMSKARTGHTATLLTDGTVMIVGPDSTAELFASLTGTFTSVGSLPYRGGRFSAMSLAASTASAWTDGSVVIAGGTLSGRMCLPICGVPLVESLAGAELYAPESGGFTVTGSLITARDGHTATVLADGTVLIVGGTNRRLVPTPTRSTWSEVDTVLSSAELFK
jgi:hypothetical protein